MREILVIEPDTIARRLAARTRSLNNAFRWARTTMLVSLIPVMFALAFQRLDLIIAALALAACLQIVFNLFLESKYPTFPCNRRPDGCGKQIEATEPWLCGDCGVSHNESKLKAYFGISKYEFYSCGERCCDCGNLPSSVRCPHCGSIIILNEQKYYLEETDFIIRPRHITSVFVIENFSDAPPPKPKLKSHADYLYERELNEKRPSNEESTNAIGADDEGQPRLPRRE